MSNNNQSTSRIFWRIPEDQCFDTIEERDMFFVNNPYRLNETDPSYCPICKVGHRQYDWYKTSTSQILPATGWKETYLNWQGPPGNNGKNGISSIKVGKVETIEWNENAYILLEGTDTDLVLNFFIPRGKPGGLTPSGIDIKSTDGSVDIKKIAKPSTGNVDKVIFDIVASQSDEYRTLSERFNELSKTKLDKLPFDGIYNGVPNSRYIKDINIIDIQDDNGGLFKSISLYNDALSSGKFYKSISYRSSDNSIILNDIRKNIQGSDTEFNIDLKVNGKIAIENIPVYDHVDGNQRRWMLLSTDLQFNNSGEDLFIVNNVVDIEDGHEATHYNSINDRKGSIIKWLGIDDIDERISRKVSEVVATEVQKATSSLRTTINNQQRQISDLTSRIARLESALARIESNT